MNYKIVRSQDARRSETPNAVMTTLASPTVSGAVDTSLWLVEMKAGASGPIHAMDSDQHWHVLRGSLQCEIDGVNNDLQAGDTITITAETTRQFRAVTDVVMVVTGKSNAAASTEPGVAPVVPPWIS